MRFLIDAQLPPALQIWLQNHGHEAAHVLNLGMAGADDWAVWKRCCDDQAILLTKDEDFVGIRRSASDGGAVIWLRLGNATNDRLLAWLGSRWPLVLAGLAAGETIIEVR